MSGRKRWALCADDYALSADVSAGILRLARQGRLTATSAMVLSPRWPQDAAPLRELQGQLDVGLHLDWTSDFALAAGHGASLGRIMWRALFSAWDTQESRERVRQTMEHQLDAFEAHWQRAPTHVDGHQHVHQFAGIRHVLVDVLTRRYGPTERPWLRISQVAQPGLKAKIISAWGAEALWHWAQTSQWPCMTPLLGVYDFNPAESVYAQHMTTWLNHSPAQALLMCHPACDAAASAQALVPDAIHVSDLIHAARLQEFVYLQSETFAQALQAAQIDLVRPSTLSMHTERAEVGG
jgi:predicted glycoside hydrolase/deacetylase ChbG (UPF0249 family)